MDFETQRWELFLQICDKQDLDLKGENIKDYKSNFRSAFMKAHNITTYYNLLKTDVESMKGNNND